MVFKALLALARLWARLFYRFRAEGVENIPQEGPCIIAINHPGKLLADFFTILTIAPRRMPVGIMPTPFRTEEGTRNWFVLILRYAPRFAPVIRVQRGGDSPASSNLLMLQALQEGHAVFLAAEGEVSWHGRMNPVRDGAAWMALRAHAPIVPVGISGTYDVWPRWAERPHLTGKVTVRVGRPFYLSDAPLERMDYDLLKRSNERIKEEIERLLV